MFPELAGSREELMEALKLPALLQGDEVYSQGAEMSTLHWVSQQAAETQGTDL